jgi:hypothetical protein
MRGLSPYPFIAAPASTYTRVTAARPSHSRTAPVRLA